MHRQLTAAVIAGVAMWLLAGLWHKIIAVQFYTQETGAQHEGTVIIFIAYLILSFIMVYLYSRMNFTAGDLLQGLDFGAVIGILWVFPHELAMAGAHGESLRYVLINSAWHIVEQGVGGVTLAYMLAKKV